MSENTQQVQAGDGCMVHAGILTSHGGDVSKAQLTKGYKNSATDKFIDEVINELVNPNTDPLPCGKPIPPLDPKLAEVFKDLKDEKKFPDFHQKILGYYRDLARSLETTSKFKLFPVCDPIALSPQLFPDSPTPKIEKLSDFLKFAIPNPAALAVEFAKAGVKDPLIKEKTGLEVPLTPAGLLYAFSQKVASGDIKQVPVPPIPPVPPIQGQLVSGGSTVSNPWQGVEEQTVQPYDTRGPDLAAQIGAFGINIPKFMPQLVAAMPVFVIKMITKGPAAALNTICGIVADDSGLLGVGVNDPSGNPQDIVMRAARKVLARKITEMCVFHAMASTIGTSTGGLVGLMAGGAKDKLVTEGKSGLIAEYNAASKDTQNLFIEGAQAVHSEGMVVDTVNAPVTYTNPPSGIDFDGFIIKDGEEIPWRTSLQQGQLSNKLQVPPYAPRGGDANDDELFEIEEVEKVSEDPQIKDFAEHNKSAREELAKKQKSPEPGSNQEKLQKVNEALQKEVKSTNPEENLSELPEDPDEYPPWLVLKKEPEPPPPPEVPETEPEVDNPFEPRGYDLPKDTKTESAVPPGGGGGGIGGGIRELVKNKAIEGAGLTFSGNKSAYSEFIFPAEFAANPRRAEVSAKTTSSCGVFARACFAAAGATYYFNPKDGGWKQEYRGPRPGTVSVATPDTEAGEIGQKIGPQVVVKNYFTSEYIVNSVITAFLQIGKKRDAIKYMLGKDKKMCNLEPGDVLVITNSEHVIVCVSSFDPTKDTFFDAVEGGQTDGGNILKPADKCSYKKEGAASSAYWPSRFFWQGATGDVSDHPAASSVKPLKKIFRPGGSRVLFSEKRELYFVVDAEKFING